MGQAEKYFSTSLQKLETIQGEVGEVQFQLYEALASDLSQETEEGIRKAVVDMEDVQRIVGMIQTALIKVLVEHKRELRAAASGATSASSTPPQEVSREPKREVIASTPVDPPETPALKESPLAVPPSIETRGVPAPRKATWNVEEWLKQRGLTLVKTRQLLPRSQSADELALFLGDHFGQLEDFYWMLKRQVLGGVHDRIGLNGKTDAAKEAMREWGRSLLKRVYLKDFYVDPKGGVIRAHIQDQQDVRSFIEGEWLERYACGVVRREAEKQRLGQVEVMAGIQVRDEVGADAEFDVLVGGTNGKVTWIECKSGQWRAYLDRYRWLNMDHLKLGQDRAVLAITEELDDEQRQKASEVSGMTILHVQDLPRWVEKALQ